MKSNVTSMYRHHKSLKINQGDIFRDLNIITEYYNNDSSLDVNEFNIEDVKQFKFPYFVVLSQACDLDKDYDSFQKYVYYNEKYDLGSLNNIPNNDLQSIYSMYDKLLPSILLCPAFPATSLREGEHLKNYDNYILNRINSKDWDKVKKNNMSRYHFLKEDLDFQIPNLVIDFKRYYTVPTSYLYSSFDELYLSSLNELYREHLSQRFTNYLSRIGLP